MAATGKKVKQSVIFKLSILSKIRKDLSADLRILYYNYYIKPGNTGILLFYMESM